MTKIYHHTKYNQPQKCFPYNLTIIQKVALTN